MEQEDQTRTLSFVCDCVEQIRPDIEHQPDANTLAHALLDCIPANVGLQTALTQQALSSAVALFWQLLDPAHSRLAVKLAQASYQVPTAQSLKFCHNAELLCRECTVHASN